MPAVIILLPLGLLALWLAMLGMQRGNSDWLVPLVSRLLHPNGNIFKRSALWAAGKLLQGVSALIRDVTHYMSVAVAHASGPIVHWLHSIARWFEAIGADAERFAGDVAWSFERLTRHTMPRVVHAAVRAATRPLHIGLAHAERDLAQLRRYAHGIDRLVRRDALPRIRHLAHEVDVVVPREFARTRAVERALARDLARVKGQVAGLKGLLSATGIAALVGTALATLGLSFLRCPAFRRMGNKIGCGGFANIESLVGLLFGEALAGLVLLDLCDTVRVIESIAELTEPVIRELVIATDDLAGHCGYDLAAGMELGGYDGPWLAAGM